MFREIIIFFERLLRGFKWFKRGFETPDFDYSYLYEIIEYKLKDMEKIFAKSEKYSTSRRINLTLQYALHHLEYIIDEYKSVEKLHELLDSKYKNKDASVIERIRSLSPKTKYGKLLVRIEKIRLERNIRHEERFFYTLKKFSKFWWL